MRESIQSILNKHNVIVEFKKYKEVPTGDGFHIVADLYVNKKKAIYFEDLGNGGEATYTILNEKNALPLLEIEKNNWNGESAFPDSDLLKDIKYGIVDLCYNLSEDFMSRQQDLKKARKSILLKFPNQKADSYLSYNTKYSLEKLQLILKNEIKNWS